MEDLNQQINQILSDPQSMQQIQEMAAALGLGGVQPASQPESAPPQSGGIDPAVLSGLLSSLGGGGQQSPAPPPAPNPIAALGGVTPEMLQMVGRLAPLLGQVNREDDSTRLLHALRPLLSQPRQQKLDEAIKILQMMRLLPLLKNTGLISGFLPGI